MVHFIAGFCAKVATLCALIGLSIGAISCQARPVEHVSDETTQSTGANVMVLNSAALPPVPGYVHSLDRTVFRIGDSPELEYTGPTLQRWRGTLGAFAIDPTNGRATGIIDATTSHGPYMLDAKEQGQAVKSYFVSAGIPVDQIGPVNAQYVLRYGGPTDAATGPGELYRVITTLTRVVDGIPVVDSQAAAVMTTAGQTDWESILWPPLDASVVAQAVAFAQSVKDPATRAAFLAKLPGSAVHETGVVIRHTAASIHAAPLAYVSFDVTVDAASDAIDRHFDPNGQEFRLPQEQASGPHYARN